MRIAAQIFCVGVACLLGSGCALITSGAQVIAHRTCEAVDDKIELQRDKKWAHEAWDKQRVAMKPLQPSHDYADGFIEGFQAYLFAGGNGEPPVLPPERYRKPRYQNPEGYRAIEDWFAGYRHGASVAKDRGYRDLVTGPSSLRSDTGPTENTGVIYETPNLKVLGPPAEPLPPPQKLKGSGQGN
jgi:hypothetical protein